MTKIHPVHPIFQHCLLQILAHIPWTSGTPLRSQSPQSLSNVEWASYNTFEPAGPGTYAFGYDIEDPVADNIQFRDEERFDNGTVVGSYGYVKPDGNAHIVTYIADENGYRATVEDPVGQPKFYGYSKEDLLEKTSSGGFLTAMKSQNIYKKQKIHEQRLRPIDSVLQNIRYDDGFPKKIDIQKTQNDDYLTNHYFTNPEKYYIRY